MSLFGQTKRHTPGSKPRRSPLPHFTSDAESEKYGLTGSGVYPSRWFTIVPIPVPHNPFKSSSSDSPLVNGNGAFSHHPLSHRPRRYIRLYLPIPPHLLPRQSILRLLTLLLLTVGVVLFFLGFRKSPSGHNTWSPPFVDPNTLVLTPDEVAMIWEWEIQSGHHPSLQTGTPKDQLLPRNLHLL
ncbi:hypothetical protein P7C73_g4475, partial [Tremellales sp. Uapishka_1]